MMLVIPASVGAPSVANVITALSIVSVPVVACVVCSTVVSLRESMFVEAARAIVASDVRQGGKTD